MTIDSRITNLGVDHCARVTVPTPCSSKIVAGFVDDSLEARLPQFVEAEDSSKTTTNDKGIHLEIVRIGTGLGSPASIISKLGGDMRHCE